MRDRRAEWLWKLSTEFYADPMFATICLHLDEEAWVWSADGLHRARPQGESLATLESTNAVKPEVAEGLTEFLNFFETVAVLARVGQFDRQRTHEVFGYWTERMKECGAVPYLKQEKYTHLAAWVEDPAAAG